MISQSIVTPVNRRHAEAALCRIAKAETGVRCFSIKLGWIPAPAFVPLKLDFGATLFRGNESCNLYS